MVRCKGSRKIILDTMSVGAKLGYRWGTRNNWHRCSAVSSVKGERGAREVELEFLPANPRKKGGKGRASSSGVENSVDLPGDGDLAFLPGTSIK